jgi:Ca2+-binding EF-hand superfamily protein
MPGFTQHEIFHSIFDGAGKGLLDQQALQAGARELGLTLSRAETRAVLRRMSSLTGGAVDRDNFFQALMIDHTALAQAHNTVLSKG